MCYFYETLFQNIFPFYVCSIQEKFNFYSIFYVILVFMPKIEYILVLRGII